MTLVDLTVVAVVSGLWLVFWRYRRIAKGLQLGRAVRLIVVGFSGIASFFLADLVIMHGLPFVVGHEQAMEAMRLLHLEGLWVFALFVIVTLGAGFLDLLRRGLPATAQNLADLAGEADTQRQRLAAFFGLSPVPLCVLDDKLRFIQVNEAMACVHGVPVEDHLGKYWLEIVPQLADRVEPVLERVLATRESVLDVELTVEMPLGSDQRKKFTASFFPFTLANNEIGVGVVAVDRTETEELHAQLLQAQKMEAVGRLAGGVAHDFNNVLTVIRGHADLMSLKPSVDSNSIEQIRRASSRATLLTRQLLAFSRQQLLAPRVIDLSAAVEEMQPMLKSLLGEDIELVIWTRRDCRVLADPGQIQQVIMNLVVNAREAMPEGGQLRIEVDRLDEGAARKAESAQWCLLRVTDSGVGLEPGSESKIFDPFFSTKQTGTGLGLATVYGIAKQCGGDVRVESTKGVGTLFEVSLPHVEASPCSRPEALSGESVRRGRGELVLVVEDEDAVRSYVVTALRSAGYRTVEAADGMEALSVAAQHRASIDLLLTDVVMPGIGGQDLVESLHDVRPELPAVFMSGYAPDEPGRCLPDGARFLQKPFGSEALITEVQKALRGKKGSPPLYLAKPAPAGPGSDARVRTASR